LAAKISNEIGDFEISRAFIEKAKELKRRIQLLKTKALIERKIRKEEVKNLDLEKEVNQALQIASIAENENRWMDAIKYYQRFVEKNYEMGDIERAKTVEQKIAKIEHNLKNK